MWLSTHSLPAWLHLIHYGFLITYFTECHKDFRRNLPRVSGFQLERPRSNLVALSSSIHHELSDLVSLILRGRPEIVSMERPRAILALGRPDEILADAKRNDRFDLQARFIQRMG